MGQILKGLFKIPSDLIQCQEKSFLPAWTRPESTAASWPPCLAAGARSRLLINSRMKKSYMVALACS
jgi:hypothetical protein